MKILIDVNLPPAWVEELRAGGFDAVHWTSVGPPMASDIELLAFARSRGYVVFTHDLDFGRLLALTRDSGPSVLQVRTQNVLPDAIGALGTAVLQECHGALLEGALVSVDERTARVRVLPIR